MNYYNGAPVWIDKTALPNTRKTAKPTDIKSVKNVAVIITKQARYRGATFEGTFVIAEESIKSIPKHGWHKVKIYCRWYGHRLKTTSPSFTINMDASKVVENYSEDVFTNFGN